MICGGSEVGKLTWADLKLILQIEQEEWCLTDWLNAFLSSSLLSPPPSLFKGVQSAVWPLVLFLCSFKESKWGPSEVLNIFIKLLLWGLPLLPPCFLLFFSVHPNYPRKLGRTGFSSKDPAMRLLPATCCAARSCTIAPAGPCCDKPGKPHHTWLGHIWQGGFAQTESTGSKERGGGETVGIRGIGFCGPAVSCFSGCYQ